MAKKRNWQGVNSEDVEELLATPDFINREKCGCPYTIFCFRIPGETIEGTLENCAHRDRSDRAKTAHLVCLNSADKKEFTVAIRLNKRLGHTVEKNRLWGRFIKITYAGSIRTRFGHNEKIYRVEVDNGILTENYKEVENGKPKRRKYRKNRPIRRPAAAGAGRS